MTGETVLSNLSPRFEIISLATFCRCLGCNPMYSFVGVNPIELSGGFFPSRHAKACAVNGLIARETKREAIEYRRHL